MAIGSVNNNNKKYRVNIKLWRKRMHSEMRMVLESIINEKLLKT